MKNSIVHKFSCRLFVFLIAVSEFVLAFNLMSCATLQDVVVNFDGSAKFADIQNIEENFAFIDAASVLNNDVSSKEHAEMFALTGRNRRCFCKRTNGKSRKCASLGFARAYTASFGSKIESGGLL